MSDKYTTARLAKGPDHFEILVKPEPALEYKLGKQVALSQVLLIEEIYSDAGKGTRASTEKLQKAFGSADAIKVAEEIMKSGELQLTTDQRRKLVEDKRRQIVAIIVRNAIDPRTGAPHPPLRIEQAMEQIRISIDPFKSAEEQAKNIIDQLRPVIPLKIGNQIYSACVGLLEVDGNRVSVVPLKGGYIPHVGDIVGGRVMDIGLSGWTVDILAPYVAMLPASETEGPRGPRRRDLSEMFDVGDMVMAQVLSFDRTRDPLLTAKGPGLGKVSSGRVIQIQAAKIPRLIGRKGSMISMLKRETGCQISVGQNGIVLVWGRSPEGERVAVEAIYMLES